MSTTKISVALGFVSYVDIVMSALANAQVKSFVGRTVVAVNKLKSPGPPLTILNDDL